MARLMKVVRPPKRADDTLTVRVDPLRVGRGHARLPRGGAHASARRPSRAQAKRQMARQLSADGGGCRAGAA